MKQRNRTRAPRLLATGLSTMLFLAASQGSAEGGAYRVELLVFRYLDSAAEPLKVDALRYFPGGWRLFQPRTVIYAEDPAPLGVTSDRMRAVWRRLESASDIEPLYLQTWEQSRIDYQPPVRIHDDTVVLQRIHLPRRWADIDLTSPDFFAPYRENYYRLDGTVQLRRSRFLHLEFDLEFRVDLLPPDEADDDTLRAGTATESADRPERTGPARRQESRFQQDDNDNDGRSLVVLRPPPWWNPIPPLKEPMPEGQPALPGAAVYRLRESRQIRTDELMYFDTPYLGVIARVTATAGE